MNESTGPARSHTHFVARSYELDTAAPDAGRGFGIALYGQVKALFAPWTVAVAGCGAD